MDLFSKNFLLQTRRYATKDKHIRYDALVKGLICECAGVGLELCDVNETWLNEQVSPPTINAPLKKCIVCCKHDDLQQIMNLTGNKAGIELLVCGYSVVAVVICNIIRNGPHTGKSANNECFSYDMALFVRYEDVQQKIKEGVKIGRA